MTRIGWIYLRQRKVVHYLEVEFYQVSKHYSAHERGYLITMFYIVIYIIQWTKYGLL